MRRLKASIGDEYVDTLREVYSDVPETSDYVMYWWEKAALAVEAGATRRFGLITTNSIVQAYSRRMLDRHIAEGAKVKLAFAIADHPWVDSSDGAAVRVAMTVGCAASETIGFARIGLAGENESDPVTFQNAERIGSSLDAVSIHEKILSLEANDSMCFQGVVPAGDGFKLDANELSALGFLPGELPPVIRHYIIGRDLVQRLEERFIIDMFGLSENETRDRYPALYQRLLDRVYPERLENKRASYREKWWIFAEPRPAMRRAVASLNRFIVTPYTAKFRPFVFVKGDTLPDAMAYAIASDDGFVLGVLSSRMHSHWARETGGTLEDRPRYNSNATFFPFPFPAATESQKSDIKELAERLDAHRKRQQALHPKLTLTDMYNVLEKLRAGGPLNAKEQLIHEQGLVSVLRQIHDDLDAAVAEAYGWPANLSDEELLTRLVALNAERAAEERRGQIRWLRPDFQNAAGTATQTGLDTGPDDTTPAAALPATGKRPWPKALAEQAQAVRAQLAALGTAATPATIASAFKGARADRVSDLLQTLASLGQARTLPDGTFVAL